MNGSIVNVPSYMVKPGDVIEVKEKSKKMNIVKEALTEISKNGLSSWVTVDADGMKGTFVSVPARAEITDLADVKEQLVVELYSK